jgi:hypothetical protein
MDTQYLPPLYRVRQHLDAGEIAEVKAALVTALESSGAASRLRPGLKVAITAGSRGIDRIAEVMSTLVDWVKGRGAKPFIVAAMGSHGGGTDKGRAAVLAKLGISAESMGAEVKVDGDTVVLAEVDGVPVHFLAAAARADAVVVVNRVKPHTSYSGKYESGLVKMLAVGLGMAQGASAVHSRGARGLASMVPRMAKAVLKNAPVILGIALVENGLDRLKIIEAIAPEKIMEREPALLEAASRLRPGLPFDQADVLVIDYLGKDLSGTGIDTKVIGRLMIAGEPEPERPRIRRIVALRLSPGAGGNAYGIGLADFTTDSLLAASDPALARMNALASTFVERARIPLSFPSDRDAISAAVSTCQNPDPSSLKIARIHSTLRLSEIILSKPLLDSISPSLPILAGPLDWPFDDRGNLFS